MQILKLEEAASYLRMSKQKLNLLVAKGKIPGSKLQGRWLFIQDDLIKYLRSLYNKNVELELTHQEDASWVSTSKVICGGFQSLTLDKEYEEALGLKKDKKRNSSTIS